MDGSGSFGHLTASGAAFLLLAAAPSVGCPTTLSHAVHFHVFDLNVDLPDVYFPTAALPVFYPEFAFLGVSIRHCALVPDLPLGILKTVQSHIKTLTPFFYLSYSACLLLDLIEITWQIFVF